MLNSPIDEIKNRLNIVDVVQTYVKLQKAGANFRALCPFHSEKTPSFFVSPSRQIWHCFGACSTGGDIFKFVMKIEGVEFGDALRILAKKAGVELKREDQKLKTERQRLYEICELSSQFFEKQLQESTVGKEAKKYLLNRGISEESIKKWRLGYSPIAWQGLSDFLVSKGYKREEIVKASLAIRKEPEEIPNNSPVPFRIERGEASSDYSHTYDRFRGRIMFPIFNLSSQIIGFGGRIFKAIKRADKEEAKYINISNTLLYDKSRVLYGLNRAGIEIRKKDVFVLVEGYTDVITANQAGFENVVSTSGTALTPYQLRILKRYSNNLLTAFDMDVAGDSATKRSIGLAQIFGFDIKIITMPKGTDPADIISKSPDEWQNLVKRAKTIHDFYFENILSKFDKKTLEGKKEISKTLLPIIKRIPNKIEQAVWIQDLAKNLEVKEEDISEELKKTKIEELEHVAEELIEKTISSPQKKRKELLEEHLVVLIIKSPKNLDLVSEEELKLFSSQTLKIIHCFRENKSISLKNFPDELTKQINYLFWRAELEPFFAPTFNEGPKDFFTENKGLTGEVYSHKEIDTIIEKEFTHCLKEIKTLAIKDKLDKISKEIKKAEEEKNFEKVQELVQKFNQCSQSRSELERA